MKNLTLPTYEDVAAAAERIKGFANKTPVLTSRTVNNEFEAEVFFKCENFQRVGAFKFRGAMNALSQFDEAQKKLVWLLSLREIMLNLLRCQQKSLVFLQQLSCPKMLLLQKWQRRGNTEAILLNMTAIQKIGNKLEKRSPKKWSDINSIL